MNYPRISIIVPVYNAGSYLYRCLDSIITQAFTNWEAILVDDGSTDDSGNICDEYAQKDSRIKVIHKPNGGVSTARNKGIEVCNGQWCCFVDSDDWLDSTYLLNFIVDDFDKYGCVIQGFCKEIEGCNIARLSTFPDKVIATASELEYILENTEGVHNGFLWHRIFRVQTIKDNHLRFPIGMSYAEDGVFFFNYILHSTCFRMTSKVGYHYLIRKNSLTSKGKKLPKENLYNPLDLLTSPTIQIIAKDKPKKQIEKGLKLYIWRLIFCWILKRGTKCKSDYLQNLIFLRNYFDKYPELTNVDANSYSLSRIVRIVTSSPSTIRYYALMIMIRIYYVESRLRKKVNSILSNTYDN